eukprot:GAFH01004983.1.p1 GENE.GAFH01004983.1~~GAFH01004983.1.p1  ORF type:complete len:220 (-),score=35.72 GAFH01004983.1:50-643(-)
MGRDKFENEDLIKYGWPEDMWFHVDGFSSAHVYLRPKPGTPPPTIDTLPPEILEECCQLVKNNSIEGKKEQSVSVCWTPWANLRKDGGMDVGQVGFRDQHQVRHRRVERNRDIVKRVEATREERQVSVAAERSARDREERRKQTEARLLQAQRDQQEKEEAERQREVREYRSLMTEENMHSNQEQRMTAKQFEDSFM